MKNETLMKLLGSETKIYDLEQLRYAGMPAMETVQPAMHFLLHRQHRYYYDPEKAGPRSSSSGIIVMADHSGTHIDAPCHQASDMKMFDGTVVDQNVETPWGYLKNDASEIPIKLRKGVLVDVAAQLQDPLPEKHEITLEEFLNTVEKEGITFGKDDVIFVRTGYGKYWDNAKKYERAAGVSKEVSQYLAGKCWAIGVDNLSWDVPETLDPESNSHLAAHLYLLAQRGVYIIENAYLEELSRDKAYEFLFVGFPLKFKGATGSPFRPVAIV